MLLELDDVEGVDDVDGVIAEPVEGAIVVDGGVAAVDGVSGVCVVVVGGGADGVVCAMAIGAAIRKAAAVKIKALFMKSLRVPKPEGQRTWPRAVRDSQSQNFATFAGGLLRRVTCAAQQTKVGRLNQQRTYCDRSALVTYPWSSAH